MVACAQAHVAQARDCIVVLLYLGNNTTIQSLACATCAWAAYGGSEDYRGGGHWGNFNV